MKQKWLVRSLPLIVVCVMALGCRSAYYAAWEKFGVEKRDILKKRVIAARDDEQAAGQQFTNALTRLQQLYGFQGGELEKVYRKLQSDYESSEAKATAVRKRIRDVETVAGDLFAEWEKEISQISSPALQGKSRAQLVETRTRYQALHTALKRAEQTMEPVLTKFRDHVLFLKHNLNAQAIASLKGEAANIQIDISRLIDEMNASIAQANAFIESMK